MDKNTNDKIKNELKQNEVCLFMKGTPEVPQCGFSLAVANVLKHLSVKFESINVLENEENNVEVSKILEKNNIYYEIIGKTQKDSLYLNNEFNIKLNDLSELNSFWFRNYFKEN